MGEVLGAIKEFWVVFMAGVGGILWVGRLHSKVHENTRDIVRLDEATKQSIKRIESDMREHGDRTERMFEEIRADIKTLLSKVK